MEAESSKRVKVPVGVTDRLVLDSCWFMADDNLFVLLTYGCRLNEILLNRGRFF